MVGYKLNPAFTREVEELAADQAKIFGDTARCSPSPTPYSSRPKRR
jgi:hypothetical protein